MKKLISALFSIIVSATVLGQNVTYTDLSNPNEAKLNGVFHFNFDNTFTEDQLTKASNFYTEHFTAEYKATSAGFEATITIVSDDQLSRRVLERYFATLGIQKIGIDGSFLEVRPFLMKFIMLPQE
jgi:hypothetical protein